MRVLPFIMLLATSAVAITAYACEPQKISKHADLTFQNGNTIQVDVVDNATTREIGMMCLAKVNPEYGMLFVFPREANLNFWMKKTLISLDIVWIGADKKSRGLVITCKNQH